MNEKLRYNAFIATLLTLAFMFGCACILAWLGRSVEAIGVGGALTGLIGLAGVLAGSKQHSDEVTVNNKRSDPIPITDAKPEGEV
jgi:small neutral amino acid transporter SnatA (MarC family)